MRPTSDQTIADALESRSTLISVAAALQGAPRTPGYYAIFVDSRSSLPARFAARLQEQQLKLIYIGIAAKSLMERLVEQDLLHQKPSTFFRGIGAVLGYRPPPGSLVDCKNQNNYRFSAEDTAAIVAWEQEHLSVRFVAGDTSRFPNAERFAIARNCPILNTKHNPNCVPELADLREQCRRIALSRP